VLFGCRELVPPTASGNGAHSLVTSQPWGAAQWERLAEGRASTGWSRGCPTSTRARTCCPTSFRSGSQVVLVEPRRIRDRAVQLLDEEAALAETLALTWGAGEGAGDGFPRLHLPFDRLLQESKAGVLALPSTPEGPGHAGHDGAGFARWPGTRPGWPAR
jgi:transcription-repair coupling factor (superfamily II helicase)